MVMLNMSENTTTQCKGYTHPHFFHVVLSFIFSIGFLMNCISLWIFWFRIKQWNPSIILQFNLAISDAILSPLAPLFVMYTSTDHWRFGNPLCKMTAFLLSTHMYGGIYLLTLIALHRYFTIVHHQKRHVWGRKPFISKLCLVVWGCLFLQGLPFFFVLNTSDIAGATKCLNIHQSENVVLYFIWNWLIMIIGLMVPFLVTIVCYGLLCQYFLNANTIKPLTQTMISKSILTIGISLAIFVLCYIPVHLTRTVLVTAKLFAPESCPLLERTEQAYGFTWLLSTLNCCMDPILYCFASKRFRRIISKWFFSLPCAKNHRPITEGSGQQEGSALDGQDKRTPMTNTLDEDKVKDSNSGSVL
ncbi:P2Y purinoceptor 4 [Xenopus laevis]|uniref:P2Y purinoceptor 4 n=2 Tax=Xenopus laevis TaxID=8355 RepID=A0A1L8F0S0_XENLA|nr:P2Y purinoceptor 4 [Xenopus laevis]XP_018087979.1 P2Y purinoceptor 4 [Xenopus laevis]XP_018087980.1 P2Y purinoceptor 4 [Xenopus laevis]XP_018087983.1 P2Y purinoceptor 4 [Xenopus laevis]XP_041431256.1 P2Y purinoceptor 4 [Xenopus laevis]XP_041431257.1 P2Y purinoceptor 4 [Xenopus laevis]XP_041431258.1 P2Y purinoceptor 4 [Xenopus laevis]XP_041431259.1 P2Y purinoceptor 4 [Xenopus laevis]OCT65178.1 hypothetical protein XELAEV_18041417mg [Xenopus laevis]